MDGRDIKIFAMIAQKMSWLGERQSVLAENIANSDTPRYRSRDIEDLDFRQVLQNRFRTLQPERTTLGHIKGTLPALDRYRIEDVRTNYESAPNENNVILEEQMIKLADTKAQHQAVASIYRKYQSMIRLALGPGAR